MTRPQVGDEKCTFRVFGTLKITGREEIFVYGDLSADGVSVGDLARVQASQPPLEATISAVEIVDGTPSGPHLALGLQVHESDHENWRRLPKETTVQILAA